MESGGIKTGEMGSVNQFYPLAQYSKWTQLWSSKLLTIFKTLTLYKPNTIGKYILETYYWKIHMGNIQWSS